MAGAIGDVEQYIVRPHEGDAGSLWHLIIAGNVLVAKTGGAVLHLTVETVSTPKEVINEWCFWLTVNCQWHPNLLDAIDKIVGPITVVLDQAVRRYVDRNRTNLGEQSSQAS